MQAPATPAIIRGDGEGEQLGLQHADAHEAPPRWSMSRTAAHPHPAEAAMDDVRGDPGQEDDDGQQHEILDLGAARAPVTITPQHLALRHLDRARRV